MANERMTSAPELSGEFVAASYKQTAIVAGAIATSLVMYAIVAEIISRSATTGEPPAFLGTLRVALFVVAGAAIFMTTIVKGIMLRNAPADAASRLARLRTATIASMAVAELPATAGFVLVALGSARADFYMLLAISAYMMVRHFPRRGPWDEYVRRGSTSAVR
ncbi:MAG TPA: hypothetical protein VEC56_12240 [Candidatus Krumholzibacteria bacterium]|nr:hypothetical protein [Candidatus Krumholzibacteria bacterium]